MTTTITEITGIHPYADKFPMLPEQELDELSESIRANGLGGGGIATVVQLIRQRGREPIEQDAILTTSAHTAIKSLEISHEALHQDVAWLKNSLGDTRTELHQTRTELSATRQELRRLRTAWERWWDDLLIGWHHHRQQDRPPPRPDREHPPG